MDLKVVNILFIFGLIFSWKCFGYSCDYSECSCLDDMITCVDVTAPRFKYRATVTMLYMENVQIVDLREIIRKLPNLKFLTLMNMKYFDCNWLQLLSEDVRLRTNMCQSYTKADENDSKKYSKLVTDDINLPTSSETRYPVDNISSQKNFKQITRLFTQKSMQNSIYPTNRENILGMYTSITDIYESSTSTNIDHDRNFKKYTLEMMKEEKKWNQKVRSKKQIGIVVAISLSATFLIGLLAALGYLIYKKKWCHRRRPDYDQEECVLPLSESPCGDTFSVK